MINKQTNRQDTKTQIAKFLAGDDILLTAEQEKILKRWEKAYELFISNEKTWQEIRDIIAMRFAVSKHTAENDLDSTQEVFGLNRRVHKRFLIHQHLDRLNRDYELARKRIFSYFDEETGKWVENKYPPDAKELVALAKLAEAYTYALNSAPVDEDKVKLPPPIYVFKLPAGVDFPVPKLGSLLNYADNYIDYTLLNNGEPNIQSKRSTGNREGDAGATYDDTVSEG